MPSTSGACRPVGRPVSGSSPPVVDPRALQRGRAASANLSSSQGRPRPPDKPIKPSVRVRRRHNWVTYLRATSGCPRSSRRRTSRRSFAFLVGPCTSGSTPDFSREHRKSGFGSRHFGYGTSSPGKEGVRDDGGIVEIVADQSGDRGIVGLEEPPRAGPMGRLRMACDPAFRGRTGRRGRRGSAPRGARQRPPYARHPVVVGPRDERSGAPRWSSAPGCARPRRADRRADEGCAPGRMQDRRQGCSTKPEVARAHHPRRRDPPTTDLGLLLLEIDLLIHDFRRERPHRAAPDRT